MEGIKVFCSYSHTDEPHRAALVAHLAALRREGLVSLWTDRDIGPGEQWEREISSRLDAADIFVALVSPDFMNSEYCWSREWAAAAQRHQLGLAKIIPIILRPVDWENSPLAKFQALPRDGKAITTWQNSDEAWLDVARGFRSIIGDFAALRKSAQHHETPTAVSSLVADEFRRIEILASRKESEPSGLSTGLAKLDRLIDGIHAKDVVLLAGRPSTGKTDFALHVARHIAIARQAPILVASTKTAIEHLGRRLICGVADVSSYRLASGSLHESDWPKLARGAGILSEAPIQFLSSPSFRDQDLLATVRSKSLRPELIVVDGVEHILCESERSSADHSAAVARFLIRLASESNSAVLCTLTIGRGLEARIDRRPLLRDLDEWEPLSDISTQALLMYRKEDDERVHGFAQGNIEVIVAKNSYGSLGTVNAMYWPELHAFKDMD